MGSRGETCYIWRTIIPALDLSALDFEDTVTPDDLGSYYNVMQLVMTFAEGEDIGTWHVGGKVGVNDLDLLPLGGAPEADGQVVIGGFVGVSSPC